MISAQRGYLSKEVSIKVDSVTIDFALDLLAKKCSCYFTYNAELINGKNKVNIDIENLSLEKILDSILIAPELLFTEYKNQVVISSKTDSIYSSLLPIDTFDIIVRGRVRDKQSLKPLPFASVAMNGAFLGTICNEKGYFSLRIPSHLKVDTLLISYVGYYTSKIALDSNNNELDVRLLQGVVSIQEVVVRNIDPKFILKNALERIEDNFYKKPYNYDAFYREAIKKDNKYSMYTEAVLNGYKPKLHNVSNTDLVQVKHSRKFSNAKGDDTVAVKVSSGLASCFQLDIIDDFPEFLKEEGVNYYDYSMVDILVWEESLVYCIEFKQKKHINESMPEGILYISINDFAIVGSEFKFSEEKIKYQSSSFVLRKTRKIRVRPMGSQYLVRYKKHGDKYYLNHVRGELFINVKQKRKLYSKDYAILIEMVITNIEKNAIKPKMAKGKRIKINSIFSESNFIYEYNNWGKNNIIEPEDDIIKAFKASGLKVYESDEL